MTRSRSAHPPALNEPDTGPLLGALLRRCHQLVVEEVNRQRAAAGFAEAQTAQNAIVRPLWDHPEGLRATELAAMAGITKQSIGTIIDQLEALAYVERVDDPADKRAKIVRLTPLGRKVGRVTRAAVRRVEADWSRRVGAERLAAMRETLTDLLASFDMKA